MNYELGIMNYKKRERKEKKKENRAIMNYEL
jgi:hypothetical protein